ncbi:MAG: hypothetical protein M0025_11310 [Elusimicrobia bacterium]|nr:hypothetical protein [Elusimicrobiota bacterium]
MDFSFAQFKNRWVAYFDLLGFSSMASSNSDFGRQLVLDIYAEVIEKVKDVSKEAAGHSAPVMPVWFSDSFLMYTPGDTPLEYRAIISASKRFIEKQIRGGIPACGIIGFGELFAHAEKNVFIGKVLCDVVRLEQNLHSVGLFISDDAVKKARSYNLQPTRHGFQPMGEKGFAYTFYGGPANFRNPCLSKLEEMQRLAPPAAKDKYEGVIKHVEKFARKI